MSEQMYESKISNSAAICVYQEYSKNVLIAKMRGNFWKFHGYFCKGRDLLHLEESLYLLEKGNIAIEERIPIDYTEVKAIVPEEANTVPLEDITSESTNTMEANEKKNETPALPGNRRVHFASYYEKIIGLIGLPYYLVYSKLKNLDYIVVRHCEKPVSFRSGLEMEDLLNRATSDANVAGKVSFLQQCAAFRVFLKDFSWSKKLASTINPLGYVVILADEQLPSGAVLLKLLSEAGEVPLMIAQVSFTHYVSIFEFTNAEACLNLQTEAPFALTDPLASMQGVVEHARSKKKSKKRPPPKPTPEPESRPGPGDQGSLDAIDAVQRNVKSRTELDTSNSHSSVYTDVVDVVEDIVSQIEKEYS